MILSKTGEHGTRIGLYLAARPGTAYVPIRDVARECRIPFYAAGKICQRLARAGILATNRGPRGGVVLAPAARDSTLLDVVRAANGLTGISRCVLGLETCGNDQPCPLHERWGQLRNDLLEMLSSKTLGQLAEDLVAGRSSLEGFRGASDPGTTGV